MSSLEIRDMSPEDEYFVGTCPHTHESEEIDVCSEIRRSWIRDKLEKGMRVKVALWEDESVGFLYMIPIEMSPWGPLGKDLMVIPCLYVLDKGKSKGVGRALINAAEEETVKQGKKALVTTAYDHEHWFMPAAFFRSVGFERCSGDPNDTEKLYWKMFDDTAEAPTPPTPNYDHGSVPGKVVVDLFWNTFCQTSVIEAQRVREVFAEFGNEVRLNEYCADDGEILQRYQISRAIFVNGEHLWWGYAPKDGIRTAIRGGLEEG